MKNVKTTTLSAQVAVSKTENGMDYVQVVPSEMRRDLPKILTKCIKAVNKHLIKKGFCL